jgi:hypothetical protein
VNYSPLFCSVSDQGRLRGYSRVRSLPHRRLLYDQTLYMANVYKRWTKGRLIKKNWFENPFRNSAPDYAFSTTFFSKSFLNTEFILPYPRFSMFSARSIAVSVISCRLDKGSCHMLYLYCKWHIYLEQVADMDAFASATSEQNKTFYFKLYHYQGKLQ